ncbi:MAG TPA: POTRA domain-containing protein [Chitinophagaceae bacterium]|nr:POTRA domain-containing protein [Chitinophagaceae bacterium]
MVVFCLGCGRLFAQETPITPGNGQGAPTNLNTTTPLDSARPFIVRNIIISGNRKTKPYIIERELLFKRGDSVNLADLVSRFERSKELLMNTALFHEAIVSLKEFNGHHVDIAIDVKERWYLFPIPYVKPVDRNLSEWAKQGYGFDRLNYGLKLNYNNFTGRNDKLKAWLITGYSKQIQLQYELPYVDKALKNGIRVGFTYRTNKEVNYGTDNNEQQFHRDSSGNTVLSKQWSAFVSFTHRPAIRTRNTISLAYIGQEVDTSITNRNPKYFSNGRTRLSFPEITYKVEYSDLDYNPYPQKGVSGEVSILKRGFNKSFNLWQLSARGGKHGFLAPKLSYSLQASGTLRLPFDQPFINQQLFGYGDFYLRGLEKYVMDGVAAILFKNTLRRQILQFYIPTPFTSHDRIPFTIFLKTYADAGYAYNKLQSGNTLTNRMLYTGGFGIDLLTFYDLSFKIEYSFNQRGQSGLFFHFKNDF